MPTINVNFSLIANGAHVASVAETVTAASMLQLVEPIPSPSTNLAVVCPIDEDNLKGLVIVSDRALTVKTNSSSEPDDTITLAAGVPVVWTVNSAGAKPITEDVANLYVTNASGEAAELSIYALTDPTP